MGRRYHVSDINMKGFLDVNRKEKFTKSPNALEIQFFENLKITEIVSGLIKTLTRFVPAFPIEPYIDEHSSRFSSTGC